MKYYGTYLHLGLDWKKSPNLKPNESLGNILEKTLYGNLTLQSSTQDLGKRKKTWTGCKYIVFLLHNTRVDVSQSDLNVIYYYFSFIITAILIICM